MPARVLDGDGLWRSKKLRQMPSQFRAEYANLLPLAEANGVFECDPDRIWSDVYAYNRPDVTPETVLEILNALAEVDLLRCWEVDGHVYGYWTAIHKSGRLPTGKHLERYKNLPPNPPEVFLSDKPLSRIIPECSGIDQDQSRMIRRGLVLVWNGIGLGLVHAAPPFENENEEQPHGQGDAPKDDDVNSKSSIQVSSLTILQVPAEDSPDVWKQIKVLERAFGSQTVATEFERWANEVVGDLRGKPVISFLKVAPRRLAVGRSASETSSGGVDAAKQLARDLSHASDDQVLFNERARGTLAELLKDYTHDEIVSAFRIFFGNLNTDNTRNLDFAAKNFLETADQLIFSAQRKKREAEEQEAMMVRMKARMEREAAEDIRKMEEAEAAEQEAVEESL